MKKVKSKEEWRIGNIQYPTSKPESEQSNHPITPVANGQRQVCGLRVGYGREGPPGRARSPGTGISPLRDHPPWQLLPEFIEGGNIQYKNKLSNYKQMNINILINNKNNFFLTTNFLTIKFFKIMKKQILILAFVVMAVFASVTQSYGQLLPDLPSAPAAGVPAPLPIACNVAATPLKPIPGNPYDYEVSVAIPTGTGTFTYDWFITNDPALITAKTPVTPTAVFYNSHISAVGSGAGLSTYHDPTVGGKAKINITWQSWVPDPMVPVFLVIYVNNTATCATNNIQVYKIEPQPAFTLDVVNLTAAGAVAAEAYLTCVAPIVTARWDQPTDKIVMDYGEDYLFYAVTAANFSHSWKPAFKASPSIALGTSTMDVSWAYPAESTGTAVWHPTTGSAATQWDVAAADVVAAKATNGAVGAAGETIIVRVHIDWNNEPNVLDNTISFAVDGVMKDPATAADYTNPVFGDLNASNAVAADCGKTDGFLNDKTTQIITARPQITSVPATVPFIIKTN